MLHRQDSSLASDPNWAELPTELPGQIWILAVFFGWTQPLAGISVRMLPLAECTMSHTSLLSLADFPSDSCESMPK